MIRAALMLLFVLTEVGWAAPAEDELGRLGEGLQHALCADSSTRPPTLEALRGASGDSEPKDAVWELEIPWSAARALELLLGGSELRYPSAWLESAGGEVGARTKLSEEICLTLVTPGKLPTLLSASPSRFIELKPVTKNQTRVQLWIRDATGRFASISGRWLAPGWIESSEVVRVQAASRSFRRVLQPVTGELLGFGVFSGDKPLGSLGYEGDLKKLAPQALTELRTLYWRWAFEDLAYRKLRTEPARADLTRQVLKDFLKEFLNYRPKSGAASATKDPEVERILASARSLVKPISWVAFARDPDLERLVERYRAKLESGISPR